MESWQIYVIVAACLAVVAFYFIFLRGKALSSTEALKMLEETELVFIRQDEERDGELEYKRYQLKNGKARVYYLLDDSNPFCIQEEIQIEAKGYHTRTLVFYRGSIEGKDAQHIQAALNIHRLITEAVEASHHPNS